MTVEEVLAWLAEIFEEPPGRLHAGMQRDDVPAWDSLGQLLLMAALDQRFQIRLTPAELASFTSVRQVLDVLERRGHLKGA